VGVAELAAGGTENQIDMPLHQFRKGGLGVLPDESLEQFGVVHVQREVPGRAGK
jgi:hypothetical protein